MVGFLLWVVVPRVVVVMAVLVEVVKKTNASVRRGHKQWRRVARNMDELGAPGVVSVARAWQMCI